MAVQQFLGIGPARVGVREVGFEHDVVDSDAMTLDHRRGLVEQTEEEVPLEQLRRVESGVDPDAPLVAVLPVVVIEAIE